MKVQDIDTIGGDNPKGGSVIGYKSVVLMAKLDFVEKESFLHPLSEGECAIFRA